MATPEPTAIAKINNYLSSDPIRARFAEVVGEHNSGAYISSVLLAVADSETLQKCQITSIYISALRAATLRLSVDPGLGQAYLVPFGGKATLIVGYKGLMDMAVRTGKYRFINVSPIKEGITIEENPISGLITLMSLKGHATSQKVIGWLAAFEMMNGYSKTLYMTIEELHEHAQKYSKGYNYKNNKDEFTSLWHKEPAKMERKTVLRLLMRRWGYLDPSDAAMLTEIESEPDSIDADAIEGSWDTDTFELNQPEQKSETELMAELGYGPDTSKALPREEPPTHNFAPPAPPVADPTMNVSHLDGTLIKHLVAQGTFKNEFNAAAIMKQIMPEKAPFKAYLEKACNYRAWRNRLTDGGVEKAEAILLAIEKANSGEACPVEGQEDLPGIEV